MMKVTFQSCKNPIFAVIKSSSYDGRTRLRSFPTIAIFLRAQAFEQMGEALLIFH